MRQLPGQKIEEDESSSESYTGKGPDEEDDKVDEEDSGKGRGASEPHDVDEPEIFDVDDGDEEEPSTVAGSGERYVDRSHRASAEFIAQGRASHQSDVRKAWSSESKLSRQQKKDDLRLGTSPVHITILFLEKDTSPKKSRQLRH